MKAEEGRNPQPMRTEGSARKGKTDTDKVSMNQAPIKRGRKPVLNMKCVHFHSALRIRSDNGPCQKFRKFPTPLSFCVDLNPLPQLHESCSCKQFL